MLKLAIKPRITSQIRQFSSRNMPAFTLYGARGSTNTDRVRLTLAEAGFTDYELVLLDLQKGEQKSKDQISRHPFGKVPALTTPAGLTLYESRPISKYLAALYTPSLLPPPSDLPATALFDQAASTEIHYFATPAGTIAFEKFAKKFIGIPADEKVVTAAVESLEKFFDIAEETLLKEEGYMAGSEFGLVDIWYVPLVQRLFACGYGELILKRERVRGWWERVVGREAIKGVLDADKAAAEGPRKKQKTEK